MQGELGTGCFGSLQPVVWVPTSFVLCWQPGGGELRAGVPAHHVPQPRAPAVRELPRWHRYVLTPSTCT